MFWAGYGQDMRSLEDSFRLEGVQLWTAREVFPCVDLEVERGIVTKLNIRDSEPRSSRILMPAGVDVQVHLRVPGQTHKENSETGLRAAVYGGYSAILTMPNTTPVIDSAKVVKEARAEIEKASDQFGVRVDISAAATEGQLGKRLVDFESLAESGVRAFTDDGKGVASDELMAEIFKMTAALKLPFLQHAEMPGHGGCLAPGPVQKEEGVPEYPETAELEMVARDLRLLEAYPQARYHVLHISSAKTPELLSAARKKGLQVSGEVSPHHLYFSSDNISKANMAFKMNPPLRSEEDRRLLRKALASGDIDFVATDHAPHTESEKGNRFIESAYGTLGLETCLPVLLDLYRKSEISPTRLVEAFSTKPAEFLGLDRSYGNIAEGLALRAVLVDLSLELKKQQELEIQSLSKNSCFSEEGIMGQLVARFFPGRNFLLHSASL